MDQPVIESPADLAAAPVIEWESLPPAARGLMRAFTALGCALPLVPLGFVLLFALDAWPFAPRLALWLSALGLAIGLGVWWGGRRWARTAFALDSGALRIRRGVWWRSETLVPRSRVQHTDLNRGPLDRRFGLASLKVYTAGTKLASVELAGLPEARAQQLRDALVSADDDAL